MRWSQLHVQARAKLTGPMFNPALACLGWAWAKLGLKEKNWANFYQRDLILLKSHAFIHHFIYVRITSPWFFFFGQGLQSHATLVENEATKKRRSHEHKKGDRKDFKRLFGIVFLCFFLTETMKISFF